MIRGKTNSVEKSPSINLEIFKKILI